MLIPIPLFLPHSRMQQPSTDGTHLVTMMTPPKQPCPVRYLVTEYKENQPPCLSSTVPLTPTGGKATSPQIAMATPSQTPTKQLGPGPRENLAANRLLDGLGHQSLEVKNTFIHFGSPARTITLSTPPKTVPSNFAPEVQFLQTESRVKAPVPTAQVPFPTPSTCTGPVGETEPVLALPLQMQPTAGLNPVLAQQPGRFAGQLLRLSDFLPSPVAAPAPANIAQALGPQGPVLCDQSKSTMVGSLPPMVNSGTGLGICCWQGLEAMMPPVPPLPGPLPLSGAPMMPYTCGGQYSQVCTQAMPQLLPMPLMPTAPMQFQAQMPSCPEVVTSPQALPPVPTMVPAGPLPFAPIAELGEENGQQAYQRHATTSGTIENAEDPAVAVTFEGGRLHFLTAGEAQRLSLKGSGAASHSSEFGSEHCAVQSESSQYTMAPTAPSPVQSGLMRVSISAGHFPEPGSGACNNYGMWCMPGSMQGSVQGSMF